MTSIETRTLRVGAWRVEPRHGRMTRDADAVRLEPRMLRLLLCLAERPGELLGADELAQAVSPGSIVTPDSVYQAIASLRRLLGDDPKAPSYVVTEPRRGYRLIAAVSVESGGAQETAAAPPPLVLNTGQVRIAPAGDPGNASTLEVPGGSPVTELAAAQGEPIRGARRRHFLIAVLGFSAGAFGVRYLRHAPDAAPSAPRSIAVLPFQDLTDSMGEEPFADGMTEELIDRLSKSGLRVPAPTAVNYYRDKALPVADIARQLGVSYLLDGSVRKSGERLRIAARLMRADDGFVLWSETYERPRDDLLKLQDEIATAVAAALQGQIGAVPR